MTESDVLNVLNDWNRLNETGNEAVQIVQAVPNVQVVIYEPGKHTDEC